MDNINSYKRPKQGAGATLDQIGPAGGSDILYTDRTITKNGSKNIFEGKKKADGVEYGGFGGADILNPSEEVGE